MNSGATGVLSIKAVKRRGTKRITWGQLALPWSEALESDRMRSSPKCPECYGHHL